MLESPGMNSAIPHLLVLQHADQRIAVLRSRLDAFPKRIKEADAKLSGARHEVAAAKEAHTNSLKERKKLELDAEQWKERARKYRDQTAAIKTNEAYKALQHEISNAEAEVAKGEDRVLEHMMAAEEIDRRIKAGEAALKEAEKTIEAERKEIASEQGALQMELDAALAERQAAAAPVPEDLLELYTRIAKRHNGVALAEARDEQCKRCGMRVLPHTFQELRAAGNEEIIRCETCGCIFYVVEPKPAAGGPGHADAASAAADSSA